MDDSLNNPATPEMGQMADAPTESPQIDSEADKWKSLSRANEARWKAASTELEAATAKTAELEQAIADMRTDHAHQLVSTHLDHAAELHGIELGPEALARLNLSSFINAAGQVDSAAIADFLATFAPAQNQPKFAQNVGIGPQGSGPPEGPRPVPLDARARR